MHTIASQAKIQTICLAVIAACVVTYFIFWLRPILVPFVVALFVVSGITPLLETLELRLRVNRLVAAGITFLTGLAALVTLGLCLWLSVMQMAEKGQAYREQVSNLVLKMQSWSVWEGIAGPRTNSLNTSLEEETTEAADDPLQVSIDGAKFPSRPLDRFRETLDSFVREGLTRLSAELFGLVTTSVVVLIYVFFLLLGSIEVKSSTSPLQAIDKQVRSYLFVKTIISIITGAVFGLALWIFGVPMSLTFGVLAFLLNYIPNVGPLVASLLPIPFILLHPNGSIAWMISAITITSSIQIISGNVIEPKIMGDSSDLHPVAILLALMFWGMMWGITGMFLATPITAGIKIVLESIESTRPLADLLAGRWGAPATSTKTPETH